MSTTARPSKHRSAELWRRVLAVAEKRLPALTRLRRAESLPIRFDRRRIYVLPTRFGIGFAALLLIMLLGALNYGNNPAVLLTCLLGAAAGASLYFGFHDINGLCLERVDADAVHAGDPLRIRLRFNPGVRARSSLRMRHGAIATAFALPADAQTDATLEIVAARRGTFAPGRVRVWTDYPLGLFQLWSWANPDATLLIYPALEKPAAPLPFAGGIDGEQPYAGASEEHAGLRDYRNGDAARLIAWKPSVRHDRLLVRDLERRAGEVLTLDYFALGGLDAEARIRRLAAWVVAADARQLSFALRVPGTTIAAGRGAQHRHDCLRALALLPAAEPDDDDA